MDKRQSNEDFWGGMALSSILWLGLYVLSKIITLVVETSGYENKIVIQYHNPNVQYDRQLVLDLVDKSGISTNFTNKEVSMTPWRMEWTLTNPKKDESSK